jgi:DNA invertase Pin-like site-specific DNA recombinase
VDDGFTGTNFSRPAFMQMIADIEAGKIDCVAVKDLSRFGRDYIDAGRYLERWFPEHGVRFIAVNDNIDSGKAAYDMLVPVKNIFNAQYAKDISQKVRSAFKAKQKSGEFIGAFACYGYQKDPKNHNRLCIDPAAAKVVLNIFNRYESGMGKIAIAKSLNENGIPCPSEYKKLTGERYHNGRRIGSTTYWTYATIHRMLSNQTYIGNLEQGRNARTAMHGKAKQLDRDDWIVVEGTHEPIISRAQWDRVQVLLQKNTYSPDFEQNISPFAGYLTCGECGRAMVKTRTADGIEYYACGSYKRYGPSFCTKHSISRPELEQIVLQDLNRIIETVPDLKKLTKETAGNAEHLHSFGAESEKLVLSLDRVRRLKQGSYEDYKEGLLSRADYLRYTTDYDEQEQKLLNQLEMVKNQSDNDNPLDRPWVNDLIRLGHMTQLDRATVAAVLDGIKIFKDGRVEIFYLFSDELRPVLLQ